MDTSHQPMDPRSVLGVLCRAEAHLEEAVSVVVLYGPHRHALVVRDGRLAPQATSELLVQAAFSLADPDAVGAELTCPVDTDRS